MMRPIMQEWLDDLRDPANAAKQGRRSLQPAADKFCCLGRLCLVAERHGVELERTADGRIIGFELGRQWGVIDWMRDQSGVDVGPETVAGVTVTDLNDHCRLSFAEIADAVEAAL